MKDIQIEPIPGGTVFKTSPVKIVESTKKQGGKLSFATRVDTGFIFNLTSECENIGKFIGLDVDPQTNILTIYFEKKDNELEKELAHEMR